MRRLGVEKNELPSTTFKSSYNHSDNHDGMVAKSGNQPSTQKCSC